VVVDVVVVVVPVDEDEVVIPAEVAVLSAKGCA
jgi:hypothetical protein